MVEKTDCVSHKHMASHTPQEWQSKDVQRNSHTRSHHFHHAPASMAEGHLTPKKRATDQERRFPSHGRHSFIRNRFVAPGEAVASVHPARKQITVFSTASELWPEFS